MASFQKMPQIFHFPRWFFSSPRWWLPSAGKPIVWWLDCWLPDGTVLYRLKTGAFLCHRLPISSDDFWLMNWLPIVTLWTGCHALNCHQIRPERLKSDRAWTFVTLLQLWYKEFERQTLPRHKCCIRVEFGQWLKTVFFYVFFTDCLLWGYHQDLKRRVGKLYV